MDKFTFFKRLSLWPKITFSLTQVVTVHRGDNLVHELYVRDQTLPCSRLFVCLIMEGEAAGLTEPRALIWLEEFNAGKRAFSLPAMAPSLPVSVFSEATAVATL